jgi:hypothetical protein
MSEEVFVVVKVPIQPIVNDIRSRNDLREELFEAKLEGDNLVLLFKRLPERLNGSAKIDIHVPPLKEQRPVNVAPIRQVGKGITATQRRRRKLSSRNRMKTRGWQVAAKILNSRGQSAVIYRPFVEALFRKQLTPAQQRQLVAEILRSNGNSPTETSVDYFLTNTLEYLEQVNKQEKR